MPDLPSLLSDFDYFLPEELIAQTPARPRESARLLTVTQDEFSDHFIADLPQLLRPGDLLVVNDTAVLPAALIGRRGQGKVRINLHRRLSEDSWLAFAKPAKKNARQELRSFLQTGFQLLLPKKQIAVR